MAITKASGQAVAPAAKGDLVVGSATNDAAVLGVGTNGQLLTVDSTTATGLKWAAVSAFAPNFTLLNSGGTSTTGAATITINVSSYDQYYIYYTGVSGSGSGTIYLRINNDTGSNYYGTGIYMDSTLSGTNLAPSAAFPINQSAAGTTTFTGNWMISGGKSTGIKTFSGSSWRSGSSGNIGYTWNGHYAASAAITSLVFVIDSGTFDAGTVYVYGA